MFMIQSGRFTFSGQWCKRNKKLDHASTEIIWMSFFNPNDISAADVASVVFGCGDPGDDIYGHMDFRAALDFSNAASFFQDSEDTSKAF